MKRGRKQKSCLICHQRKKKCDQEKPSCSQCIALGASELCCYDENDTLEPYRKRRNMSLSNHMETASNGSGHIQKRENEDDNSFLNRFGYDSRTNPELVQVLEETGEEDLEDIDRSQISLSDQNCKYLQKLPSRNLCQKLINGYFKHCNLLYGTLDEDLVNEQLRTFWSEDHKKEMSFAALLFRIFSITLQHIVITGVDTYRVKDEMALSYSQAMSIYRQAADEIHSLLIINEKFNNLNTIEERLLTISFVKTEGNMRQAWLLIGSVLRLSLAIGLNRELKDPRAMRLWRGVFMWESTVSLMLGRKAMVSSDDMVLPDISSVSIPHMYHYYVAKHSIYGYEVSTMSESNSSCILRRVSEALKTSYSNIPKYLRRDSPDESYDRQYPQLRAQRLLIDISTNAVLCCLYRKTIKLGLVSEPQVSHQTVVQCAQRVLDSAHLLVRDLKVYSVSAPAFYIFDSAFMLAICGISLARSGVIDDSILTTLDTAIMDLNVLSRYSLLGRRALGVIAHMKKKCQNEFRDVGVVPPVNGGFSDNLDANLFSEFLDLGTVGAFEELCFTF